jgi:hypothetical protein
MAKVLTSKPSTECGASWQTEPTCPNLPFTTFSCFRFHHRQTQWKAIILNISDDSHKKALFTGGTISHAARTEQQQKNKTFHTAPKN